MYRRTVTSALEAGARPARRRPEQKCPGRPRMAAGTALLTRAGPSDQRWDWRGLTERKGYDRHRRDDRSRDGEIIDERQLEEQLLAQAREQGMGLVGAGGLLARLTRTVLETALEAEMTEHLGHERHGAAEGPNVRNGTRSTTVLTEIGPVEIGVPRDRESTFEPQIVKKRKRRRAEAPVPRHPLP